MGTVQRLAMAFGLIGCLPSGVCQPGGSDFPGQNASDAVSFERFFREPLRLKNVSVPVLQNGLPVERLTIATPQDLFGLTVEGARILDAVASGCEAKLRVFDSSTQTTIFDARLDVIDSQSAPLPIQQLKTLQDQRDQIVLAHIQLLRLALGEMQFKVLETYVRGRKPADSFFPVVRVTN